MIGIVQWAISNDQSEQAPSIEPPEACICVHFQRLREGFSQTGFTNKTYASTVGSLDEFLVEVADIIIVKRKERGPTKMEIEAEHLQAHLRVKPHL